MDPIEIFRVILLFLLVCCAIGAGFSRKPFVSVIIFMSYSGMMAIVWALLQSPDLAITEAAVGAGVSTVLFFMCLRKVGGMEGTDRKKQPEDPEKKSGNTSAGITARNGSGISADSCPEEGKDGSLKTVVHHSEKPVEEKREEG